jgi:hypothetical protein
MKGKHVKRPTSSRCRNTIPKATQVKARCTTKVAEMITQNFLEAHFPLKKEIIPPKVTTVQKIAASHLSGAPATIATMLATRVTATVITCSQVLARECTSFLADTVIKVPPSLDDAYCHSNGTELLRHWFDKWESLGERFRRFSSYVNSVSRIIQSIAGVEEWI